MDFYSLSRRELQALCKRNKIPANVTNVAMIDSLKALAIVEGIDEVLQACKSEISQSSIEPQARLEVTSPYVPPTGGRSTSQKDLLSTPAQSGVTSRRVRATKEDSAVKQVYGTRRSARLAEKGAKLLKGVTEFSKKDLFTGDGQDFKMNLEESLEGSDEVSGVTDMEKSQRKDEVQGDSGDKQDVSTGVDANTLVEVNFEEKDESKAEVKLLPEIEEEHHSTVDNAKIELNDSMGAEIEQVGYGSETEEIGNCDDTKAYHDEVLALALNLNIETRKADGSDAIQTSETKIARIKAEKIEEEKTAEDAEPVDETVTEDADDFAIAEVSSDTVIHSDDEVLNDVYYNSDEVIALDENEEDLELNTDSSETESNPDESDSVNLDLIEESTKSSDSLISMDSRISFMSDEDDTFNWDVIPEIDETRSSKQYVTADKETETVQPATNATSKQDVVALDDPLPIRLQNPPTRQLAIVALNNVGASFTTEKEAIPPFTMQPTFRTPKRASASKASSRMVRVAAVSDNKENICSGSKTAPAKERSKIVKEIAERVSMLADPILKQLSTNLKDLTINQNLDKNEGENGVHSLS